MRILTGTLYQYLRQMHDDDGLIEEVPPARDPSTDERRRYYGITRFRREVAAAEVRCMEGFVGATARRLLGRARSPGSA